MTLIIVAILAALLIWDLLQPRHSILRNFPLVGHLRYFLELIRPEVRQYFIESDIDGRPFNRNERSLIYERAKDTEDLEPFGTELNVYDKSYYYLRHSIKACLPQDRSFRINVGGDACEKKYSASIFNISAMSFGSLGAHAVEALNLGAKKGGFYHCTGEGGISPYHLKHGGDLVWQIGTGYFGCRNQDGSFSPKLFQTAASADAVKMVELKLSQGAKPGHGGVLPKEKISEEIARIRLISRDEDCVSPSAHSTFYDPIGLCHFLQELRELSGGKPVGFKICIGFEHEFFAVCKAMLETGILPDFITVDGAEGGTGAAPIEFSDHVGMPMLAGLNFVHNTLIGCGLREKIRIAVAGKIFSAAVMVRCSILGADWFNAARPFMMALGCIQAQKCHTNHCPVGVTTMNKYLQRGLEPISKSDRVANYHRNSLRALAELIGAAGVSSLSEMDRFFISPNDPARRYIEHFSLENGQFLNGKAPTAWQELWDASSAYRFEISSKKLGKLEADNTSGDQENR